LLVENDITGGTIEEEGIFGFGFGLVATTTNFTVGLASSVTAAALDAISDATNFGCLLTGAPASMELCTTNQNSRELEDPFPEKIATSIPHMVLNAVFPVLTSPTSLLRILTYEPDRQRPLLQSSSTDLTFYSAKSHESVNSEASWDGDVPDSDLHTGEESKSAPTADSKFRTDRTLSLSTLSDDSEEDGYDQFLKLLDQDSEQRLAGHSRKECQAKEVVTPPEPCSPVFYLDFSSLMTKENENETLLTLPLTKGLNGSMFFTLQNTPQDLPPLQCMLDILVESALNLARDDSANIDNKCPVWKPEGDTKKILQRIHKLSFNDRTQELAKSVLKWTGVLKCNKEELRMIKTRGIVNMSPLDLKDLLIDCSRGHLVNKNSLGKKDICIFPCDVGTTSIVENTMKVPFVGGEIHSVSITHSRFVKDDPQIGGDFYVIVSKSVQNELDKSTGLPYYSVSVLKPVGSDAVMTDLVNVAQISGVPVPGFLVNKIAFTGAVDFFTNLRSI
jgi:hypothetical protein